MSSFDGQNLSNAEEWSVSTWCDSYDTFMYTNISMFYAGCIDHVLFLHIHLTMLSLTKMFLRYLFYLNFFSVFHQKAKEHIDLYKGRTGVLKNSFEGIFCLMKLMVFYQMTSLHYFVRWVHFLFQGTSWLYLMIKQNYKP